MKNLLFNARDRKLLESLPQDRVVIHTEKDVPLFNYHLHPRGIKELVNPKGIRVARLMGNLLGTLEAGRADDRLMALRSLRDEVFFGSEGEMSRNTARALLSVMKDLLRAGDDFQRKLELAYDFHYILTGRPSVVRKFLKQYQLLEMPEEWNQLAFDHHVHDAHTKGRKSPTHLIMDAWIKGIRKITVIYYDCIHLEAAKELLTAAEYMDIDVRIGVELKTEKWGKKITFIWTPRIFANTKELLQFLDRNEVKEFMEIGEQILEYREKEVYSAFHNFNKVQRLEFNKSFNIDLKELNEGDFKYFVGTGQASLLHLSEFIHLQALPLLKEQYDNSYYALKDSDPDTQKSLKNIMNNVNRCTPEYIVETYFQTMGDPGLSISEPIIKRSSPEALIETLDKLLPGYRLTLNLKNLGAEEVLELVYLCQGRISALEIYNHKDRAMGFSRTEEVSLIRSFQHPLNEGNPIALKRAILSIIDKIKAENRPDKTEKIKALQKILNDLPNLLKLYRAEPLYDRWGSDSTGRSTQFFGMGLAVLDTLPKRVKKEIRKKEAEIILPLHIAVKMCHTYVPAKSGKLIKEIFKKKFDISLLRSFENANKREWIPQEDSDDFPGYNNVVTLGWRSPVRDNGFSKSSNTQNTRTLKYRWRFLNTYLKNGLKILIGFIPAFLTFALTKDWWVLAYLGAPIWFGITGLRNIIQSVVSGDSFRRSPLLRWNNYVNWSRVSDSLLYTGFSVPLLDFLVKQVVLDHGFNINTSTNILALYGFMGLVNGVYISTHNYFRGLPPAAIIGNFFRSILSIPVAVFFNFLLTGLLTSMGVAGVAAVLQKWAAVISKAASDSVAGVIEGAADRSRNLKLRRKDYKRKMEHMYSSFVNLELLLPETDLFKLFDDPDKLIETIKTEYPELLHTAIYNALDLLYFWMYQPHARTVFKKMIRQMTDDERRIFIRFQHVLKQRDIICNFFIQGLLGKNFFKALEFYLGRNESYLLTMDKFAD